MVTHSVDYEAQLASAASRHAADMASLETRVSAAVAALREQRSNPLAESTPAVQVELRQVLARMEVVSGWCGQPVASDHVCMRCHVGLCVHGTQGCLFARYRSR
jgi:hypothetical protein